MKSRLFTLCDMLAPLVFIIAARLGGALRPGHSHISETVSELFSPGSLNKTFLDVLHTTFATLLAAFGVKLLGFFWKQGPLSAGWQQVSDPT